MDKERNKIDPELDEKTGGGKKISNSGVKKEDDSIRIRRRKKCPARAEEKGKGGKKIA